MSAVAGGVPRVAVAGVDHVGAGVPVGVVDGPRGADARAGPGVRRGLARLLAVRVLRGPQGDGEARARVAGPDEDAVRRVVLPRHVRVLPAHGGLAPVGVAVEVLAV